MKTLSLFFIMALATISVRAQTIPVDTVNKTVVYTGVVNADNILKDELFVRAKAWFAKTYRSSNNVLQMDDRDAGKLIGHGSDLLSYRYALISMGYYLKYIIEVDVKDGKYKYTISDITVPDTDPAGYHLTLDEIVVAGKTKVERTKKDNGEYRNRFKGYVTESDKFINELISSLKKGMENKSSDF